MEISEKNDIGNKIENISKYEIKDNIQQLDLNNTLNTNPFIMPKTQNSDNLKLKLMEKDKIIFDYMKREKENEKIIEELKSALLEKDEEFLKLKEEIKELEYSFNKRHNITNQTNIQNSIINNENKNIISNLQHENDELKKNIIELNNIVKIYEQEKKGLYEECQKNSEKIENLINQLTKNEGVMKIFKKNEDFLKEENKQIPHLKSKISESESMIKDYQKQINELKMNNDKIIIDKEKLNDIISQKSEQIKKEKINEQYVIRLNYKIDYLSKELNSKNLENENINKINSTMKKDVDNYINIFLTELNNYLNYLEGLNIYSKTLHKLANNSIPNFENANLSQDFRVKYEIMSKTINQIKEKINDILNKNIEKNQNLIIDFINKEHNYKLIIDEKEKLLKDKIENDTNLINQKAQISKYKSDIQKMTTDNNKLTSELLKLQNFNKEYMNKNKILNQELTDFINDISNQLKDFPSNNKSNNTKSKILSQINGLILLNKELNGQIKNLEEKNTKCENELFQSLNEIKLLQNDLKNIKMENDNIIDGLKIKSEAELTNQKNLFIEKIYNLSHLLEESNQIIKAYEAETTELKNKVIKYENNLKLLSHSHNQLEKIIDNNDQGLKNTIEIKEQKNNDLLKELEIKDIHIKSLEKLVDNQNKPAPGKIFSQIKAIPMELNNENNSKEESFVQDDITEIKLNKLINVCEIKNKIKNFNLDVPN